MKKHCGECGNVIKVRVVDHGHEINIEDIEHSDNAITITKDEAEFVIKELRKIL